MAFTGGNALDDAARRHFGFDRFSRRGVAESGTFLGDMESGAGHDDLDFLSRPNHVGLIDSVEKQGLACRERTEQAGSGRVFARVQVRIMLVVNEPELQVARTGNGSGRQWMGGDQRRAAQTALEGQVNTPFDGTIAACTHTAISPWFPTWGQEEAWLGAGGQIQALIHIADADRSQGVGIIFRGQHFQPSPCLGAQDLKILPGGAGHRMSDSECSE